MTNNPNNPLGEQAPSPSGMTPEGLAKLRERNAPGGDYWNGYIKDLDEVNDIAISMSEKELQPELIRNLRAAGYHAGPDGQQVLACKDLDAFNVKLDPERQAAVAAIFSAEV